MTRRIAIVTVGRADYSILRPVWRALQGAGADVGFWVAGGHLSADQGLTRSTLTDDGAPIWAQVPCTPADDSPAAVAVATGQATVGFARAAVDTAPDAVVLLGDRYETMAAATAVSALPIPLVHIHGGEVSEGAVDERYRHAVTKLSHLHFAATATAAARLRQLGEEDWRIHVSGAPGIDALLTADRLAPADAFAALGLDYPGPYLLVTLHPETVGDATPAMTEALATALETLDLPLLVTAANADAGGQAITARLRALCDRLPNARFVTSCGPRLYPSILAGALAVVGNSSSGLIEAPALGKPVVNIGERQAGRERPIHVADCPADAQAVIAAVRAAVARAPQLADAPTPYGDGRASQRIAEVLMRTPLDTTLLRKRFADRPATV